jgi:hypothetical protein
MKDANLMIKMLLPHTFLSDNDSFQDPIRFNSQSP